MKKTFTMMTTFIALTVSSQSISFERDTTQTLQNADASSIAYADIDLDGDNDLLITGSPGVTTLYQNDGNGNFTAMPQPDIVHVYDGAVKFVDVDNDGDMDLFISGNTSSSAATANLYLNDGSGNFTIVTDTPFEASNSGDIDFGDIDSDNDLDLIITGKDAAGNVFTKLYINDGTGTYTLVSGTPFTPVWTSSTVFIDVDNDGDLDLLICGANSSDVSTTNLYKNNGTGTFNLVAGTPFDNVQLGDIAFGDTDNDGDQDILIVGLNDSNQYIAKFYVNNGSSFSLLLNTPFPGTFLHSAAFADFNNDGELDLLHVGASSSGLIGHIYENQGSNNFILADSTLSGSYNGSNITADLNRDNQIDIVTTGTSFTAPIWAPKIYINHSVPVSANELNNDNLDLVIFPNPANGYINIEMNSKSLTEIEIYDITGRVVLSDTFFEKMLNLHLKETPGIYTVRIKRDNKTYTRKIQLK
jgi:hypothetical protein